ncbi:MAG: hypothetical protein R2838_20020 [Caldilineaceae bacterium]
MLKIVAGWLSDRLGKRKALATFGYAVSTVAKPFLVLVTSWTGVLAVRVAERFGKGVRPARCPHRDSIDESKRGLAFGFHALRTVPARSRASWLPFWSSGSPNRAPPC